MSAESKLAARLHDAFFASEGLRIGKAVWLALADAVRAAGWVSPEEATARETAARREALLEAAEKHRVEVERLTDAFTDAARVGHDNAKAYLTERRRIARVEALADCPPGDCEGHPCIWPEDIRAALAEPERDEEGGR